MPRPLLVALCLLAIPLSARAEGPAKVPSPTETDPDKYQVILENERVRVFRYHDTPGAKTKLHHHEAFVLYVLSPFKRRLIFADGSSKERQFKNGDVIYMEAQDHAGENIGTVDTEAVIVELKEPGAKAPANAGEWKATPPKK